LRNERWVSSSTAAAADFDEEALFAAIQAGKVAGAALDVYARNRQEPQAVYVGAGDRLTPRRRLDDKHGSRRGEVAELLIKFYGEFLAWR